MLHFLTAVVVSGYLTPSLFEGRDAPVCWRLFLLPTLQGSTCDVRVKNGTTYEGIFKTLSSKVSALKLAGLWNFTKGEENEMG